MKNLYYIKRNNSIDTKVINTGIKKKKKKSIQALMLKNVIFNKKEMFLFSITGIVRIRKNNMVNKSFVFVGNTARTSIKYAFDSNYPGVVLF